MSNDLLGFTKLMSGINLAEYVINYIDQHMLISGFFLGKINNQILVSTENEATVKYTLTGLSDYEKGSIEVFKEHIKRDPVLTIYDTKYYIEIPDIEQIEDEFIIIIKPYSE